MSLPGSRTSKTPPIVVEHDGVQLKIQPDARTDIFSTFRVGGPADFQTRAGTEQEIALALDWAASQNVPVTVFGGGSNMLISDRGIRGLMLIVKRPGRDVEDRLEILDEDPDQVLVRVPAAAPLSWLGRTACERGWADMAWAVGLPGNVGGATVNNAGAHGGDMRGSLAGLRIVDVAGNLFEWTREQLNPEYRRTVLKAAGNPRESVVVDVTFRFGRGSAEELYARADSHAEYRHSTQPTGACAGSIFKNPPGNYSAVLVEKTGLKGLRVGGAVVSMKHANFIVNDNKATAAQIVELIELVQQRVEEETGVRLDTEVERVGEWT